MAAGYQEIEIGKAYRTYGEGRKPGLLNRQNGFRWQWLPWIGVCVIIWAGAIFGVGRLFGWW